MTKDYQTAIRDLLANKQIKKQDRTVRMIAYMIQQVSSQLERIQKEIQSLGSLVNCQRKIYLSSVSEVQTLKLNIIEVMQTVEDVALMMSRGWNTKRIIKRIHQQVKYKKTKIQALQKCSPQIQQPSDSQPKSYIEELMGFQTTPTLFRFCHTATLPQPIDISSIEEEVDLELSQSLATMMFNIDEQIQQFQVFSSCLSSNEVKPLPDALRKQYMQVKQQLQKQAPSPPKIKAIHELYLKIRSTIQQQFVKIKKIQTQQLQQFTTTDTYNYYKT